MEKVNKRTQTNFSQAARQRIRTALIGALSLAAGAGSLALARLVYRAHIRPLGKTMFGQAFAAQVEDEQGEPVKLLLIGRSVQSGTYLSERMFDPPFAYHRAFDCIFAGDMPVSQVLVLGGGGYAWPKHVLAHYPDVSLEVVELDPRITEIARKHFFLAELEEQLKQEAASVAQAKSADQTKDDTHHAPAAGRSGHPSSEGELQATPRLRIVHEDARSFIEHTTQRYDAVVSDCYLGASAVASLDSIEAFTCMKALLNPGGIFVANVVSGKSTTRLIALCETCAALFEHVWTIDATDSYFSDEENTLVVASDKDIKLSDAVTWK